MSKKKTTKKETKASKFLEELDTISADINRQMQFMDRKTELYLRTATAIKEGGDKFVEEYEEDIKKTVEYLRNVPVPSIFNEEEKGEGQD